MAGQKLSLVHLMTQRTQIQADIWVINFILRVWRIKRGTGIMDHLVLTEQRNGCEVLWRIPPSSCSCIALTGCSSGDGVFHVMPPSAHWQLHALSVPGSFTAVSTVNIHDNMPQYITSPNKDDILFNCNKELFRLLCVEVFCQVPWLSQMLLRILRSGLQLLTSTLLRTTKKQFSKTELPTLESGHKM